MIAFHPLITMAEAAQAANSIGCMIVPDMKGGGCIVPRELREVELEALKAMQPNAKAGQGVVAEPLVRHCRAGDYKDWEQRQTCVACAHPLADNQLVKDAYKLNATAAWAKQKLSILHDMAKDRGGMEWFAEQAQKIADRIQPLDANKENPKS